MTHSPAAPGGEAAGARPDLQVERVSKRYGSFTAVDDLSLDVARGSFFSILGPSGCGKTTLLRMIAGFMGPDAGDIRIGGQSMRAVPPNQRPVNMVFQHLALFPMMNVGENVAYGLARRGVARDQITRRVGDMLERVGLPGAQGKRVDQLSGGQKQRVAIARSLVLEPTLLLLDEPAAGLTAPDIKELISYIRKIRDSGVTVILIEHHMDVVMGICDTVSVLDFGQKIAEGKPAQVQAYEKVITAYLGGSTITV